MDKIYYDIKNPAGFSSLAKLTRASGKTKKEVLEWLKSQRTYTLHKQSRVRGFARNRVVVGGIHDQWQVDLACLENLAKHNDGTRFVLVCIDTFSKFVFCRPLKNKSGLQVKQAFEDIFNEGVKPNSICSDDGKEFFNRHVTALLRENHISHFSTKTGMKAAVVERVIKTLKNKMFRYLTYKNSFRYIDVLQDITHAYNHSFHRTIKMTPAEVNVNNQKEIWRDLYLPFPKKQKFVFSVGEKVRISRIKGRFDKGYKHNWSDEYFVIDKQLNRVPQMYKLKDLHENQLEGAFYREELQPINVSGDEIYQIEKIVERKKIGRVPHIKVKWLNWDDSFNSWIREDTLQS